MSKSKKLKSPTRRNYNKIFFSFPFNSIILYMYLDLQNYSHSHTLDHNSFANSLPNELLAQNQRQKFAVADVLELGDHDAPRLLEQSIRWPVPVDLLKSDSVSLTNKWPISLNIGRRRQKKLRWRGINFLYYRPGIGVGWNGISSRISYTRDISWFSRSRISYLTIDLQFQLSTKISRSRHACMYYLYYLLCACCEHF